eukprot:352055-Hanusia_phi.AAC.1
MRKRDKEEEEEKRVGCEGWGVGGGVSHVSLQKDLKGISISEMVNDGEFLTREVRTKGERRRRRKGGDRGGSVNLVRSLSIAGHR